MTTCPQTQRWRQQFCKRFISCPIDAMGWPLLRCPFIETGRGNDVLMVAEPGRGGALGSPEPALCTLSQLLPSRPGVGMGATDWLGLI